MEKQNQSKNRERIKERRPGLGTEEQILWTFKAHLRDFPGGTVVKNPPANAGDTGSSPGPGRSHMPWRN